MNNNDDYGISFMDIETLISVDKNSKKKNKKILLII